MAEDKNKKAEDLVSRFFEPWEDEPIRDWESAKARIQELVRHEETYPSWCRLVWRGLNDSTYSMTSTLYRQLLDKFGEPPTEEEMWLAETSILNRARNEWRFANLSPLETFAQIRHYGGPTRFIDVSLDPLIALWFAVQPSDKDKEGEKPADGRIVASLSQTRDPSFIAEAKRGEDNDFKSDIVFKSPYIWRPPGYNERISAQNSVFLVGEIPQRIEPVGDDYYYPKDFRNVWRKLVDDDGVFFRNPHDKKEQDLEPEYSSWELSEVQKVTSVNLDMRSIRNPEREGSQYLPTFTIRILAKAKEEIRKALERQYNEASIYPDLYGLAEYLKKGAYIDHLIPIRHKLRE